MLAYATLALCVAITWERYLINSPSCYLCSLNVPGKMPHCSVWSPPCPPRSTHSQKRISTLRGENPTQRREPHSEERTPLRGENPTQRREPHSEERTPLRGENPTQRENTLGEEKHMLTQSLSMQFSHQPIPGRRDHILLCN